MGARHMLFCFVFSLHASSLLCRKMTYIRFRLASFNIRAFKAGVGDTLMDSNEVRWKIVKALLDEFPSLREKTREYVETRP